MNRRKLLSLFGVGGAAAATEAVAGPAWLFSYGRTIPMPEVTASYFGGRVGGSFGAAALKMESAPGQYDPSPDYTMTDWGSAF